MKRTLKQRVVAILVFVLFGVTCGSLAGYLLGRATVLHAAQMQLDAFADHLATEEALASAEAHSVLATLHSSSAPFCSDSEIINLSVQIYQSKFLKDAGRIHDEKIICSSIFGRFQQPFPLPASGISKSDGTKVYWNLAPFLMNGRPVRTLQQGDAYVVFGPRALEQTDSNAMYYYSRTAINHDGEPLAWKAGVWKPVDQAFSVDGEGSLNGSLYSTHCLPRYSYCLTATLPISTTLSTQRLQLAASSISGGLLAACFGFMASLLYRRNRSTEQQLRRAIRRDNLHLLYQPIVNLTTGRVIGAEALIRWTDEEGFAISPESFIHLAEERGFVYSITCLVIRHVLRDFGPLLHHSSDFRLSINVAASDLCNPHFLPMLDRALLDADLAASSLAIEITERSTANNPVAVETIRALRRRGFSIHIDDFGTGYSSLSYLHELSVDVIKIDRTFTQSVGTGAVTTSILPQILSMAESLHLGVIVEGIETTQQAIYFSAVYPPVSAQGWLYGRPIPADQFLRLLAEGKNKD